MWDQIQSSPIVVPKNVDAMEEILQSIHSRDIHLDREAVKKYNKHLGNVVSDTLIKEMKNDEVFQVLFKKISYSGSYYEKLRVNTPDEFDLNLVLQLPKEFQPIKVLAKYEEPGFAYMKLINTPLAPGTRVQQKVMKFLDADKFLLRDSVFRWLQSVVDTALKNINWQEFCDRRVRVRRSTSGPAVTLNVTHDIDKKEFSVDLVPVFSFTKDNWPNLPVRQLPADMDSRDLEWFIVPKGPRSGDNKQLWRMSFYMHEKKLMGNYANMKPTIKVLKLLRDKEGWNSISSYYIKTVFLWEKNHKEDMPQFWRNSMSYLFYHMLCVLVNCLDCNYIPFFWHEDCNLIHHVSSATTDKWANRIRVIRKNIDRRLDNPEELRKYINCIFKSKSKGEVMEEDIEEHLTTESQETFDQEHQQQGNSAAAVGITLGLLGGAAIATGIGFLADWIVRQRNRRQ